MKSLVLFIIAFSKLAHENIIISQENVPIGMSAQPRARFSSWLRGASRGKCLSAP